MFFYICATFFCPKIWKCQKFSLSLCPNFYNNKTHITMSIFNSSDIYNESHDYNKRMSPWEKYQRQDDRQHFFDCPHCEPDDCGGKCY